MITNDGAIGPSNDELLLLLGDFRISELGVGIVPLPCACLFCHCQEGLHTRAAPSLGSNVGQQIELGQVRHRHQQLEENTMQVTSTSA